MSDDEVSPRVRERQRAELRARAEAAAGSLGSAPGAGSGLREEGYGVGGIEPRSMPRDSRPPDLVLDQEIASRWTRCSRCRADVEVITANDHKDQGRCPRCRRLL